MGCCHQYFANTPEGDGAFVIDATRMVFGAGCLKEAGVRAMGMKVLQKLIVAIALGCGRQGGLSSGDA
jgi:hypothetical protein